MKKWIFVCVLIFGQPVTALLQAQSKASITTGIMVEKDIDVPLSGAKAILYEKGMKLQMSLQNPTELLPFRCNPIVNMSLKSQRKTM